MGKIVLFEGASFLVTLKAMGLNIIVGIVAWLLWMLLSVVPVAGKLLLVIWAVIVLFLWGYMGRLWWGWK